VYPVSTVTPKTRLAGRVILVLVLAVSAAPAQSGEVVATPEVFQVVDLPVAVTNPTLVKTKNGYVLRCSLSNSSEFRQLGFRYSLAVVDSGNGATSILNRTEAFKLAPFQAKTVTFKAPLRLNLKGDERLVLMVEQVISTDYVWEVLQAKDALASYIAGDYSTQPRVLRVLNAVDPRMPLQILY
jgi:hypothetical protein